MSAPTFRLHIDKQGGDWVWTIRADGWWPSPLGVEVARLNAHVIARAGGESFAQELVDALNASAPTPKRAS